MSKLGNSRAPSREAIERRAYEIYLERGAAQGNDLSDWFAAEEELFVRPETTEVPDKPPNDLHESELRSTEPRQIAQRKSASASQG
ncbi:MAG: DUF2934 domain-containing protein [Candidatus Acidiferrales bacterium]